MPLSQISDLTRDDVLRTLRFSSLLNENFDNFISATLNALNEVFDYPISTYTIFDSEPNGNRYVVENHSQFFSKLDLDYYNSIGYKEDDAFQNSEMDWAKYSSKFTFVREFRDDSTSSYFERTMRKRGIHYQIRIGSHARARSPQHVLSVYKPFDGEELGAYELQLLNVIGQVFSICVGLYKQYNRLQKDTQMFRQYFDRTQKGVAFYDPCGCSLVYNRAFPAYVARIGAEKSLSVFASDLVAEHRKTVEPMPFQMERTTASKLRDCSVTVEEKLFSPLFHDQQYYVISISEDASAKTPKPTHKKRYLAYHLTSREMEVVQLIESGLTNSEIAERLVIAMPTVKTHIKNIFSKFEVTSRMELLELLQED